MKKSLLLLLLIATILTWTGSSLAAAGELMHFKFGPNSTGLEIEKILPNGTSIYLSETMYQRHDRWNTTYDLRGQSSVAYTTMAGLRKHTQLLGHELYLGGAIGLSGFDPALNSHLGYQFQLAQGTHPIYLRAESGWSLIFEFTQDQGLESVFHLGFGIGSRFDLDFSRIYY